MRIVVVGARGQLAAAVVHACREQHEVLAWDRARLDITDGQAVASAIGQARPDAIVNGAAYNAVDAAETHPVEALQLNAMAVRNLARAAADTGATLVHYSSDFVFDGRRTSTPYVEDDVPNPRSAYAASKLLGEWFAADAPRAYVLRVESLFGTAPGAPAKGSVATIVNALRTAAVATVFEDRTVSPTYVIDAALATLALLEKNAASGVYHCVNSGQCTWHELAIEAARILGVEPRFNVKRCADVQLPAARPQFCALSNRKLAEAAFAMPTWQDALERYLSEGG